MSLTLSGTNGVVGAGFTLDASGASVTAGVGTFSSIRGDHHGDGANLTSIPAANIVGLATAGFNRSGGFPEGVTTAYQFRLTSGLSCGNSFTTLSSNWEKVDSGGQGNLGTFADPSSGIFTFPSTGIYLVRFNGYFEDSGDSPICQIRIQATTDNSSYSNVASTIDSMGNLDTYTYANVNVETLIDVTDTSNVKVYFEGKSKNTSTLDGSSAANRTYVTFIRLGDT